MIDPTPNERAAIRRGGDMGGEYLESLGKSDLAQLSQGEWLAFVECIVTGYCDALREFAERDREQLDRTRAEAPF